MAFVREYRLLSLVCKGITPLSYPASLVLIAHGICMRFVTLMALVGAACWAESVFGIWKVNPSRSTFTGDSQPKSFTVRIEPYSKGEVFTLDRTGADGRATTSSTIRYFD